MEIANPMQIGKKKIQNRIAIQPMEGNDASQDGNPSDLTLNRYERLARGGAGLIIIEACSIDKKAKARKNQLIINTKTASKFEFLIKRMKTISPEVIILIQITHSGGFSIPEPVKLFSLTEKDMDLIGDKFVYASNLAREIGIDGIDLKCCHGYLCAELLRPSNNRNDRYGRSFENRTRFFKETFEKIIRKIGNDGSFIFGSRVSIYEGIKEGFGVDKEDIEKVNLREPIKFIKLMKKLGLHYVNISIGIPAINPYISRPSRTKNDKSDREWTRELIDLTGEIKKEMQGFIIIGTGYSYFMGKSVDIANESIKNNLVDIVGFGRMSFAYPEFVRDILENRGLDKKKICIVCSKCGELLKNQEFVGCVVRNSFYRKIYNSFKK